MDKIQLLEKLHIEIQTIQIHKKQIHLELKQHKHIEPIDFRVVQYLKHINVYKWNIIN